MGNPYYIYTLSYHVFSGGTILPINHQKNIIQHYVKQNCCPIRMLGNKSDIFLEINSIRNVNSIRIYIGTTMGYTT